MTERTVEAIIPPTTVVPTELRAPAPAPLATASGMTPKMNVSDVIKMGRSRDARRPGRRLENRMPALP